MKNKEIKKIKMGTILIWQPTGELFTVTGFNEFKIKEGTATRVTGVDCDSEGLISIESMPSIYNLNKSIFYSINN